jgi:WD40 repeat protein
VSVLVVLATGALTYAVRAGLSAEEQRNAALAQSALREAASLLETDPALATQLTVAAHRLDPTAASRTAVLTMFADPYATRITGHAGVVHALAVTSDGDLLATAGDDTTLLWDISDPYHPRRLSTLATDATSVVFSGDGGLAVTGNEEGALLWDLTDPARPHRISPAGTNPTGEVPGHVAMSPDGRTLAVTRSREVRLYDVTVSDRPRRTGTLTGHTGTVTSVAFSPDGTVVATASEDRTVRLWPVAGGAPRVLTGTEAPVTAPVLAVEFSPDSRLVATAGEDGTARVWRAADGAQLASLVVRSGPVRAVAFSGDLLAAGGDDRLTAVWDVTDLGRPHELTALSGHADAVTAVRFTPDKRHLITSSRDRTVRLVSLAEAITGTVAGGSLAWGRNGTVLASGGAGTVLLSDVRDRHAPRAVATIAGTAPSIAGGVVATGERLWDVTDPARPRARGTLDDATGTTLSRDGRLLVTTYRGAHPRLWDVTDPDHPHVTAELPVARVSHAVFGDGVVATLGGDITVWDVSDPANPTARTLLTRNWTGVALRQDGKVLAAVSADGTGWLVDVADPRGLRVLATFPAGPGDTLAFAPNGRTLVTATGPAPRLWDVADPRNPAEVATLRSDNGRTITAVAFSPDGGTFATTSADGAIHVWDATVGQVERRVCAIAHPRMTVEQWQRYLPGVPYRPVCP